MAIKSSTVGEGRVGSVHERVTVIWHGNELVKQVMTKLKKKKFLAMVA